MTFQAIHNISLLLLALTVGYRLSLVKKRMRAHEAITLANAKALLTISDAIMPKPLEVSRTHASDNDDYH